MNDNATGLLWLAEIGFKIMEAIEWAKVPQFKVGDIEIDTRVLNEFQREQLRIIIERREAEMVKAMSSLGIDRHLLVGKLSFALPQRLTKV